MNENLNLTFGYMSTLNDNAPDDIRMNKFMVTLVYGWHPMVEGMRRTEGREVGQSCRDRLSISTRFINYILSRRPRPTLPIQPTCSEKIRRSPTPYSDCIMTVDQSNPREEGEKMKSRTGIRVVAFATILAAITLIAAAQGAIAAARRTRRGSSINRASPSVDSCGTRTTNGCTRTSRMRKAW